jgi:outer membrane receptor for ferrienterochelin and colicins
MANTGSRWRTGLLLAAALALPAASARGQAADRPEPERETPPADEPAAKIEEIVVTGTRTARLRADAPVATEVVTREEIAARGAANVQEALRDQLGVESNSTFYGAQATRVQMMGLDGNRVLVMVDGLRLVGDSGGALDLRRLPVDMVERIEIVKGPMSALYGTDALGGVINIVTRREERPGFHGGALAEMRALPGTPLGGGRVAADGAWAARRGGLQAAASYQALPSYDLLPGEESLSGPERRELGGELSGFVRAGEGLRVDSGVELNHSRAESRLEQTYPGLPSVLVDLPDTFWRLRARAGLEAESARLGRIQLRIANTYFAGATDKDRRDSPLDERRRKWHDLGIAELGLTRPLGERHTLSAGLQVTGEWFQQDLTRFETDGMEVLTSQVAEVPRRQLLSEEAYLQDEITLGRFVLAPGARYVHHHDFGHALAPQLAVVVAPHRRLRVRAQVGRGFRAPAAQELAFNFDHSFYGYKVVGNPDLLPETSVGALGGAELTLPRGLALHGLGYYNRLRNLIVAEVDPEQSRPELSVSTYKNVGRAYTAGVETGFSWRWSRVMLQAGYVYLRAIDEATGLPVPGRTPHTVQGAFSLKVPRAETQLDLRARGASRTLARDGGDMPLTSPGWTTVDLRLAQPLERWLGSQGGGRFEVYGGVENILGSRRDPRNPADLRPEPGRIVYAGVRARH